MAKKEKLEKKKAGPIDRREWGVWGSRKDVGQMYEKRCKSPLVWDDKTGKCVKPKKIDKETKRKERTMPSTRGIPM